MKSNFWQKFKKIFYDHWLVIFSVVLAPTIFFYWREFIIELLKKILYNPIFAYNTFGFKKNNKKEANTWNTFFVFVAAV